MKTAIFFIFFFLCIFFANHSFANTGVFYGSGNQVIPIKNNQIQLVREKVDIKLSINENSGRFGASFLPWANVTAIFYLKNTTNKAVTLQMGFPFLDLKMHGAEKVVLENLNFKVVSSGKKIKTEIKEGLIEKEFDPQGLFKKVFAWQEKFKPAESKDVVVTYRMLMGFGPTIDSKREFEEFRMRTLAAQANSNNRVFDEQRRKFMEIENLFPAFIYNFSYITKTAYTWAGPVEEAVFQLDCTSVYKELERQINASELGQWDPHFSRPIFWETIHPDSAKKDNGIYQWIFKGSVPEEGLSVGFIILFLPSLPAEVNEYFSTSLSRLENIKPDEFESVLKAYYQNIAFDKQPSDFFTESYFKEVGLFKMPKIFISDQDRENLEEIADNFDELIKK